MIKVLLSISFPPYRGGISHYLYSVFKEYKYKDQLVVITQTPLFTEPEEDLRIFRDIIRSNNLPLKGRFNRLDFYFKIIKFLFKNRGRIDYIYSESVIPTTIFSYLYKKFYPKTKIVCFAYGTDVNIFDRYLKRKSGFINILRKFLLNRVDRIITISSYTESILKKITRKEIFIISPRYTGKRIEQKEYKKKCTINLISVAQFTPRKGIQYVLKALETLKEEIDFRYYIVGNGSYREKLEKLIKDFKLEEKVFIKTDLKNSEVYKLYEESDIFVLPVFYHKGDFEGFGIVYLEAGAFRLPIIATGSGGSKDVLIDGFNCIIVKEKDYKNLAEAIKNLSKDHIKREILGNNGYKMSFYKKGDTSFLIF
ncbi:MAG: glycosyltransferase family 4 protein [candidate division WOR-3 bacterium]|jgi:glycosyltransferase involved in cell wall biosynthesis